MGSSKTVICARDYTKNKELRRAGGEEEGRGKTRRQGDQGISGQGNGVSRGVAICRGVHWSVIVGFTVRLVVAIMDN